MHHARLLVLAAVLSAVSPALATNVQVSATQGTLGPVLYPTLELAFASINDGTHGGVVSIVIVNDTTETATATLLASGNGAANYLTVAVAPSGPRQVTGTLDAPLVQLDGASFVTVDGLNASGHSLTFDNQSATTNASTVRLINGASSNMFTRLTLLGAETSATGGVFQLGLAPGAAGGNNDVMLSDSVISDSSGGLPVNGVYAAAALSALNNRLTVTGCAISDYHAPLTLSAGINLSAGTQQATITNNRLFQSAPRTLSSADTRVGILITAGNTHNVSQNVVGFASSAGTGVMTMSAAVPARFIGISVTSTAGGSASSIQGNTVSAIDFTTTSTANALPGMWCGLHVQGAGDVDVGTITGNVIGAAAGVDNVIARTSGSGGALMGVAVQASGVTRVHNNTFGALTALGSTAGVGVVVAGVAISAGQSVDIRANSIGGAAADSLRAGAASVTTGSTLALGVSVAVIPTNVTIEDNEICRLASYGTGSSSAVRGVNTPFTTSSPGRVVVRRNHLHDFVTSSPNTSIANAQPSVSGVSISGGTANEVSGNTIHALQRTNPASAGGWVVGIAQGNATDTTITGNRIYDLANASTSTSTTAPGVVAGVVVRSGINSVTVANNMISLGSGQTTDTAFVGIMGNFGSTPDPTTRVHGNSVYLGGTPGGSQSSFGIVRGDFSAATRTVPMEIIGNLVVNDRTGGSLVHSAIANNPGATVDAAGWTSDYNAYSVASTVALGFWGSAMNGASWLSSSASDLHSVFNVPVTFVDAATGNLHLNMGSAATALESRGTTLATLATDYDGQGRPGPSGSVLGGATAPDVGADEFDGTPTCGNGVFEPSLIEVCDDGNGVNGDGCDNNCTTTACGNGAVSAGEECDDGNGTSGDGCDSNCTVTACGNGVLTGTEVCDDGNAVNDDGCDNNCTASACQNGVKAGTEECDDGNPTDGDGCDNNCTVTACGNGVLTGTEVCDDGNAVNDDGCDNNCTASACQNGVKAGTEECDDGNPTDGDGCDSNCKTTACGNGILTSGEVCDDGNLTENDGCDSNCTATACQNGVMTGTEQCDDGNAVEGDGCDSNCTTTACQNGIQSAGEACDDGNPTNGDGCDMNCTVTACGNGIKTGTEGCDDGNGVEGDGCDSNCTVTSCQNGVQSPGEGCDDGNPTNGDGCDMNCTVTACQNGIMTSGEACDDGNATNGDGCDANCTMTACQNGVTTMGEACDDGNAFEGDGCDSNCTVTACQNAIVTSGEACDDGNAVEGDGCDSNCTVTACMNGVVTSGEACDDGNAVEGDGCDSNCTVSACGNGVVASDEACDDGNAVDGDGCDANCTVSACQNGVATSGEECDDGNATSGDGCDANCTLSACGNGVVALLEQCDDGNAVNGDGCDANCTTSACGNGVLAGGEACDDGNAVGGDGCDAQCAIESGSSGVTGSTGSTGGDGDGSGDGSSDGASAPKPRGCGGCSSSDGVGGAWLGLLFVVRRLRRRR